MAEDFGQRPERMSMMNLVTGDIFEAQYNPEKLSETLGVSFAEHQVLGLSHKVQQFLQTDNIRYTFELFESVLGGDAAALEKIKADRRWLKSLTHPHRASDIERGGTPRVLIVWPNLLSVTCFVKNLAFDMTQFARDGSLIRFTAKFTADEVRDVFVGMEEILVDDSTANFSGL